MDPRNPTRSRDAARIAALLAQQARWSRPLCAFLLLSIVAVGAMAASNVVEYTYDAAGNIVQIARQAAPGFSITGFDPPAGPVGTQVTIYGAGFDANPANDSVAFNGVAATVTSAASGSLSATVPAGASTGRITVTVAGATVSSATDFVVTLPSAPTITGFTPSAADAGTAVSVSGTNFDVNSGGTTAKLKGVSAAVIVSSATDLSLAVPAGAASGKLSVTTAGGTAVSATDLIVPPPGTLAADIAATARAVAAQGNVAITVPTGKKGLVLFDAEPNVFYSIQFANLAISPSTAVVAYQVMNADNSVLTSGVIGGTNRPTIHLPKLPAAGTYSVVLAAGSATLNTNVRVDINPIVAVDGAAASSSLDFAYQSARFVFDAVAGQRIGMGVAGLAFIPSNINTANNSLRVFRPDGTEIFPAPTTCGGQTSANPEGNCDGELLAPVSGTYTAVLECPSNAYGNFALQLTTEAVGTIAAPDSTQAVNLARVGQDARYTFSAAAGDSLALDLSNAALQPRAQSVQVNLYKPDGTYWTGASATPPRVLYLELGTTLPVSGIYTVSIDPTFGAYGDFNVTLKQGPVLHATDAATPFAPVGASETARFRFDGVAGQNLSLALFDLALVGTPTFNASLSVYAPNGGRLTSTQCPATWTRCHIALQNLSQTGTYSVVVQPPDSTKASGNLILSDELVGTLTPGTPVAISRTRPGQVARYTFSAVAGDSTALKFHSVSSDAAGTIGPNVSIAVLKPDGGYLTTGTVSGSSTAVILNLPSLPASGVYTVVVDPTYGASWEGVLELGPGTPIAIDGATVSPTTEQPGEPLRYTFAATAGQRIEFGMNGLAYAASSSSATGIAVTSPTGASVLSINCFTSSSGCETYTPSAPVTGTYALVVTPPAASSIVGGAFALSTPASGSLVVGDPAEVVSIGRPGQTARYTFSGSAAQLLQLSWGSPAVMGATSVAISVLKPDGTTLTSGAMVDAASGFINLPSLPVGGTYTVSFDAPFGATWSASVALITR
ncbi:MAG TPA: IPT/TIG domain-containing protein [Usitatibacter sp.]|nr:IPT/TIG domain-containing protein [Usitatibacter sp.]